MPKSGESPQISEVERRRWLARFREMQAEDPGLTYETFGRKVGLGKASISNIFTGAVKRSARKAAISAALGLDEDAIIGEIVTIVQQLDMRRLQRLHERAMALLDEQTQSSAEN